MEKFRNAYPWLLFRKPDPRARLRLFCFPYAGGGASVFRQWGSELPPEIEVCPVQLPGRENRLREPPFTRLDALADRLAEALREYMDVPFVFFGHSMGATLSFELAHRLRDSAEPGPAHLLVSGRQAPHLPYDKERIHELPDQQFIAKLQEYNGTPAEVLQHRELMELLLTPLRADFGACETYVYRERGPLDCPLSVFAGSGDADVTYEQAEAWRVHTCGAFKLRVLPGDHFFINTHRKVVLEHIARDLRPLLYGDVEARR